MTEQLFLKKYGQLPENLKQELIDFFEFLLFKQQNKQADKQQKPEKKKPENEDKSTSEKVALTEMGKRKAPKAGFLKGTFVMSPDFDEPLEDFKEYMA
jgi:hypothetical protein